MGELSEDSVANLNEVSVLCPYPLRQIRIAFAGAGFPARGPSPGPAAGCALICQFP